MITICIMLRVSYRACACVWIMVLIDWFHLLFSRAERHHLPRWSLHDPGPGVCVCVCVFVCVCHLHLSVMILTVRLMFLVPLCSPCVPACQPACHCQLKCLPSCLPASLPLQGWTPAYLPACITALFFVCFLLCLICIATYNLLAKLCMAVCVCVHARGCTRVTGNVSAIYS